jgi:hypothetical protein
VIGGQHSLPLGPYAGFSSKFLKHGSLLDLFDSIRSPTALAEMIVFLSHFQGFAVPRQPGEVIYPLDEVLALWMTALGKHVLHCNISGCHENVDRFINASIMKGRKLTKMGMTC